MGLVNQGILNMPLPGNPGDLDIVTWMQIQSAMRNAAQEIDLLRTAVVRYGDKARMSNAEPMELQQAIDRAFENQP